MGLKDAMPSLRLPVLGGRGSAVDESRLLKLYWNRAELKKELADLDQELHQLRDRLKQQEAATGRMEEEFRALESLLGNPEYGADVLVHYQLRALWRACHSQLEQFGSELVRQREERERKRQVGEYQQQRMQRLKSLAEREALVEAQVTDAQARVAAGEAQLRRLSGLWHYFRRRQLDGTLEAAREEARGRAMELAEVRAERRTAEHESWPEFPGLSLEGKRSINLAVVAYAQLLVARLDHGGLARRAWTAQREHVRDCHYGDAQACSALMAEVAAAIARVREAKDVVAELRQRTEQLRARVSYPADDDAVPVSDSLPPNLLDAERTLDEPSVLRDNYWDVYRVLRG